MLSCDYMVGMTVLGASSDEAYGPLSPAQLADLNRALTPAEQKAVDDYQNKQAEAQLAAVRKQGGPRSSTVTVTSKGAIIKSDAPTGESDWPAWKIALIGAGGLAVVVGLGMMVFGGKRSTRSMMLRGAR